MSNHDQRAADTRHQISSSPVADATSLRDKFTPGPWHIDWNGGMTPRILGLNAPGVTREIADVRFHNGSDDPQVHANARLIAAAPETAAERDRLRADKAELLAALKDILQADFLSPEARRDAVRRAGAAIAAAEGKTP